MAKKVLVIDPKGITKTKNLALGFSSFFKRCRQGGKERKKIKAVREGKEIGFPSRRSSKM